MATRCRASPTHIEYFWGTPFLEKETPKITEEGPFDPHWPISKINPGYVPSQINAKFQPLGS